MDVHTRERDNWQPGLPIDLRSDAQRLRAAKSTHGDFEFSAARVIARALGVRVELTDDGSQDGLVDGQVVYEDRPPGVFEVVTDTDPAWAATYNAIRKRGFEVRTDRVTRRWQVRLGRSCDIRALEAESPALLEQLEIVGQLFEQSREIDDPGVVGEGAVRKLANLGVTSLFSRQLAVDEESSVQLIPEGTGGYPTEDWGGFQLALSRVLHGTALEDVRAKLAASSAEERHIFLGLTMTSSWDLNFWLKAAQAGLPPESPHLPSEATHLWVWGMLPIGRVLAWFPTVGWFDPSNSWATD